MRGHKHACTDSSSGEEEKLPSCLLESAPSKRLKTDDSEVNQISSTPAPGEAALRNSLERSNLPPNIALKGGITHNIRPAAGAPNRIGNGRLNLAPAVPIPPFVGIGKKAGASSVAPPVGSSVNDKGGNIPIVNASKPAQGQQAMAVAIGSHVTRDATHPQYCVNILGG